ncbi:hypothetical protein F8A10_14835 [Paracoccus kondratievae]|uniref:hypothetical protein n=1 Tax=Paracoccus kondratievae TaxID=135740 RepID=UPI0012666B8E|nr:hypothetical protein [Paracoccus kondratievae]QFQ88730.1 hypothetical protein F8A10_14835 [Paracoccus kondratievae]
MARKLRLCVGRWISTLKAGEASKLLRAAGPPSHQAAIVMPKEARMYDVQFELYQELMEIEHFTSYRR